MRNLKNYKEIYLLSKFDSYDVFYDNLELSLKLNYI